MARRGIGPVARRLSIATRLALLVVLVAIVALAATAAVGFERGGALLDETVSDRLNTIAAGRSEGVERHVRGLRESIDRLALSPATADAIVGFTSAFEDLGTDPVPRSLEDRLADHYLDEVIPALEASRGAPVPVASLLPVTDAAVRLQAGWVVTDDDGVSPAAIDDNRDGTAWTSLHALLHPAYLRIADGLGFTDLALVSADGDVVYTVRKGIDLGTNLLIGPHSGSVLAVAASRVASDPVPGLSYLGDLARTQAAGDRPVGVVAGPVFAGDRFVGVVVGQFDAARLTGIMSAGGDWTGLGTSGQVYLAAAGGTMRSDARAFTDDAGSYLDTAVDQLTSGQERALGALGTTVTVQPVDPHLARAAASGPGNGSALSPVGDEVVASWRPLELDGLEWFVVAEVPRAELAEPVARFARFVLVAVALVVLVATFAAVGWANRMVDPLRRIADRLRRARAGNAVIEPGTPPASRSPREYLDLSDDIDRMLLRLQERQEEVVRRQAERRELLHQFLPPTIAGRAEAGEQDVLDRVGHTSVVVVELRGTGSLVRGGDHAASRKLLGDLVDELDAAAQQRGLERFRLGGHSYAAVCGASRPHLDHATRTLSFARDAHQLVAALASDAEVALTVGTGLASGAVVVGLSGGDRLVFDCWGATVDRAGDLARAAADGELLVDPATRALLPEDVATTAPLGPRPHGALRVPAATTTAGAGT